jgi:hypothetical protein
MIRTSVINAKNRVTLDLKVIKNAKWFQIRFVHGTEYLQEHMEYYCFDAKKISKIYKYLAIV